MNDFSNLPISGALVLSIAIYAGVSLIITGPLVADRSIKRIGWSQMCRANLNAEISARKSPSRVVPRLDCNSLLGVFSPDLRRVCEQHGNPDFGAPFTGIMRQQEAYRREAEEQRLSQAASQSASRCDCAATLVASNKISWASYAGSMRLISPPEVSRLSSELTRALHSPHCQRKG
ncbi:hypothetical protein [Roseibium sp. MB-4]